MSGLPWNGFGPDPATRATVGDYQGQYVAMQEMRRHWLLTEIQVNRSNAATGARVSRKPFQIHVGPPFRAFVHSLRFSRISPANLDVAARDVGRDCGGLSFEIMR